MSKEIKNLLKLAREAINNKDTKTATLKCHEVLKLDKKNYIAYCILGAIKNQENNKQEAAKYLKIALELSDDKSLALQGLANCADANEIPSIANQLLEIFPDKYSEYYSKIFNVSDEPGILDECCNIFSKEIKLNVEQERIDLALSYLLKLLFNNKEAAEKYKDEYITALKYGIKDIQNINHLDYYQTYFKCLHQSNDFETLIKEAENMHETHLTNIAPLEWILKVFIENFQDATFDVNNFLKNNKIEFYIKKLLELNTESILGYASYGFFKYSTGDFASSRDDLLKVYSAQPTWYSCSKMLGKVHMKIRAYLLAELIFRQCKNCDMELAECLVEQQKEEKIQEGIGICKQLISDSCQDQNLKVMTVLTKALIYSKQLENAEKSLAKLKDLEITEQELKLLKAKIKRYQGSFKDAINILKGIESHEILLELGINYFELQNFEESLLYILKSTKLEPFNSECFFNLGKIYIRIGDETRSAKCFEKCLSLNPQNEKAITFLSSFYRKNNEWESNLKLLESSKNSVDGINQKTAFAQLGYHHLAQRNYDDAITAFRSFLRYDSTDLGVWEGLAESYMNRGSYSSAQNIFEKTFELSEGKNVYAKLQIGKIKYILQFFQESIQVYEEILSDDPNYFPCLKGIAESHFGRAKYLLTRRIVGRSWLHAQEAQRYLEKALKIQSNVSCLWRMMGNVLDFVASLPLNYCKLTVSGAMVKEDVSVKEICNVELLQLAAKCYSRCLNINKDDEYVWYELSQNFYQKASKFSKNDQEKIQLLKLAMESCKHLLKLSGNRWQHWNLLGVICMAPEIDNPSLAQHSFMQALSLDKKSYTSWTNLGVFYLQQGDVKLANKAFGRAQQADTGFLNAWIGQSFIAELIGERDESMDLFRHCTNLGFHLDSALGYSNFVCSVLNESDYWKIPKYEYFIDKMFAVPLALDSMTWYYQAEEDNICFEALTYLGYLNGCLGFWKKAVDCYEMALEKSEGSHKDKCLTDLGYCLLKIERYKDAVKNFSAVTEATFASTVGLALSYFKAKMYEESYATYQSAVEWLASSDHEKSSVLVAMSAMVYAFQGENDAKMLLFQCIDLPSPPPEALFSLCAISLIHADKQLSDLTIKELQKFEHDEKYSHHVIFLIGQFYMKNNEKKKALDYVLGKIHVYPDRPYVRKVFTDLVMEDYKRNNKKMRRGASKMAQSSIVLRLKDTKNKLSAEEAAKTLAIACEAVRSADPKSCRLLAQKAAHMNPMYRDLLKVCN